MFDRAFRVFWDHAEPSGDLDEEPEPVQVTLAVDADEGDDDDGPDAAEPSDDPTIELRFSVSEVLRHKDFAAYDDAELAEAHRVMHRMRLTGSPADRCAWRRRPGVRARPDLRRTVRAALRTEGEACAATTAPRPRGTAGSSCCSTSAGRWSRTPAPCCASSRPRSPVGAGSRRSPSAPG